MNNVNIKRNLTRISKEKSSNNMNDFYNGRAFYYDIFSRFFLYELLIKSDELLIKEITLLINNITDEDELIYWKYLQKELNFNSNNNLIKEYNKLFILPFGVNSTIFLYLSHYLDASLSGAGLMLAKSIIKESDFRLNDEFFKESEEHFGFLLLLMKQLLQDRQIATSKRVLTELIQPMSSKIIDKVKSHSEANLFIYVVSLLDNFLTLEQFNIKEEMSG